MAPMVEQEADDARLLRFRQRSKPVRVVYARPRTFFSMVVGLAASSCCRDRCGWSLACS
jgi:hypothetical protein